MSTSEAAPPGQENARQRRRRMRKDAAIIREGDALQLYASGKTYAEIAADLRVALSTSYELVKRGLARRAETEGPVVEAAKALYLERVEILVQAWMPRAIGKGLDADLQPMPPNEAAAKIMLGLLDRYADVQPGIRQALKLDLGDARPVSGADAIAAVMASLARVTHKGEIVEGELAAAGTNLAHATNGDDRMSPPEIAAKTPRAAK